jgi:hypothetical protein
MYGPLASVNWHVHGTSTNKNRQAAGLKTQTPMNSYVRFDVFQDTYAITNIAATRIHIINPGEKTNR